MKFNQTSKSYSKNKDTGFTIMELLVAVFVAGLMVSLINFVFMDTSKAVKRGIAMANIISDSRSATSVFDRDAKRMIGPETVANNGATNNGVLMIIQDDTQALLRIGQNGTEVPRNFRTDQLMFFRTQDNPDASPMLPLAPKKNTSYSNNFRNDIADIDFTCDAVKVWYGHVLRTNDDGSPETPNDELGTSDLNAFANDWILGRQAMFMVDNTSNVLTNFVHSDNAQYSSQVDGYNVPSISNEYVYHGLNDMAGQQLGVETGVDLYTADSVQEYLNAGGTYQSYADALLQYAFPFQRLHANPSPLIDFQNDYALTSWQVAQTHPIFMTGILDFAVEFAADTDGDGFVDRDADSNGVIDSQNDPNGQIMWYGWDKYSNWDRYDQYPDDPNAPYDIFAYDPGKATVYPISRSSTNTFPETGRTYMSDVLFSPSTNSPNVNRMFVWRSDRPELWPVMIRIRYRMIDPAGSIESGDKTNGVWIEHIIPVNRPKELVKFNP